MHNAIIGTIIVLLVVAFYYFFVIKMRIAKIRIYKPADLIKNQDADSSTYQIAQVILFDSAGIALKSSDFKFNAGNACYGTNIGTIFDGNILNQNFPHVYHTCSKDTSNFIQIDLNDSQSLSLIKIYNRVDCCADRLAGVLVETYNSSDNLMNTYVLIGKPIVLVDLVHNVVS